MEDDKLILGRWLHAASQLVFVIGQNGGGKIVLDKAKSDGHL